MAVKTKPGPGYTYDVTYGAKSPQPGFTERVGDVRLQELYDSGEDFDVDESYKAEGYDEHIKAQAEDGAPKTDPEPDPQKDEGA